MVYYLIYLILCHESLRLPADQNHYPQATFLTICQGIVFNKTTVAMDHDALTLIDEFMTRNYVVVPPLRIFRYTS